MFFFDMSKVRTKYQDLFSTNLGLMAHLSHFNFELPFFNLKSINMINYISRKKTEYLKKILNLLLILKVYIQKRSKTDLMQ